VSTAPSEPTESEKGPESVRGARKALGQRELIAYSIGLIGLGFFCAFVIAPYWSPRDPKVSYKPAPAFDLPLLSGGALGDRVRSEDLRGRPMILDFWASWCAPCREQAVELSSALTELDKSIYVLGVATGEPEALARNHLAKTASPYSNAYDQDQALARALDVSELPTLVFIDRAGNLRAQVRGAQSRAQIESLAASLLAGGTE
jgi:peroxiredoxin